MHNLKVDEIAAVASDHDKTISSTIELKTITLGFLIPLSVLGLIIGKKGQRMKGDFTDVEILIQRYSDTPADSNERVVFITGNFKSIVTAQEVMLNIVKMKRPNFDRINSDCSEVRVGDNEVLFRGVITGRLTGLLIGKSGANIKAIHDATGCWVKIGHEEERIRGSKERQIYIQGPPESVAQARLLVAAKVPIHSVSSTNTVEYYPISFPIAESLRNENNMFLQEVNRASGATVDLLSIDALETGENVTHIVIEGKKEVNDIARSLLDSFVNEWKSTHLVTDHQYSNSNDTSEVQVVVRWCLPSEIVSFLFDSIISIQYIQKVSNIILHILYDRPSTSLTSQDTVLVMIGTLKGIVEAEQIILTKIYEIVQAPSSLLQLKNKIFKSADLLVDAFPDVDRTSVMTTTTTTTTMTSPLPIESSSHPSHRSSIYPHSRNETRTSNNESKRTHSSSRRLSSQFEYKSTNRNQPTSIVTSYSGGIQSQSQPQDTSVIGNNLQHSVLYAENDETVASLGVMLQSQQISPSSSSTYLDDTLTTTITTTTATEHKIQRNLSSERHTATTNEDNKYGREVLEEKSTAATSSRRRSSNPRVPTLPTQTLRAPALFQNPGGVQMLGGYNYNYTLLQHQQLQQEFFYRQEQERQQFLYWQALQQQQQQLSLSSYAPYPYGLPPSSSSHNHHQQYIPSLPFSYQPQHSQVLGDYSPRHSRHYQPPVPYRNYYQPQSSSIPPISQSFPTTSVPVPVPVSPLLLPLPSDVPSAVINEQLQPQHSSISSPLNPSIESTDHSNNSINEQQK